MAALFQGKPLRDMKVADVMARTVLTCRSGDDLEEVERTMQAEQVRRLPVVDESGAVIGMISMADLAREAARSQFGQRHEVPASAVMTDPCENFHACRSLRRARHRSARNTAH